MLVFQHNFNNFKSRKFILYGQHFCSEFMKYSIMKKFIYLSWQIKNRKNLILANPENKNISILTFSKNYFQHLWYNYGYLSFVHRIFYIYN